MKTLSDFPASVNDVYAVLDAANTVTESNESDNQAQQQIDQMLFLPIIAR